MNLQTNYNFFPEYLTPQQASTLTGFTVRALEALRSKRRGPAFLKFGKAKCSPVRYKLEDIRSWMQSHQEVANGQ